MGAWFSSWFGGATPNYRVLTLGLDAAGKTTILFQMKLGETRTTTPTIGFNVETVEYKNLKFTMWDIGGQDKLRPLWRSYYPGTQAIIFVIDAADDDRLMLAKRELGKLMEEAELKDCALLVFANKQDLPNAKTASAVQDALELRGLTGRNWFIQGCCATTGQGLHEGLDWLSQQLRGK